MEARIRSGCPRPQPKPIPRSKYFRMSDWVSRLPVEPYPRLNPNRDLDNALWSTPQIQNWDGRMQHLTKFKIQWVAFVPLQEKWHGISFSRERSRFQTHWTAIPQWTALLPPTSWVWECKRTSGEPKQTVMSLLHLIKIWFLNNEGVKSKPLLLLEFKKKIWIKKEILIQIW